MRHAYTAPSCIGRPRARGRLTARLVDVTDTEVGVRPCAYAALVWLESPTNPARDRRHRDDRRGAQRRRAYVVVDTPSQPPAAIFLSPEARHWVVHSATKYLSCTPDAVLGAVVTRRQLYDVLKGRRGSGRGSRDAGVVGSPARTAHAHLRSTLPLSTPLSGHTPRPSPVLAEVRYPGFGGHRVALWSPAAADAADVSLTRRHCCWCMHLARGVILR